MRYENRCEERTHFNSAKQLQELCDKYVGEIDKILAETKKKAGAK